MQLPPKLEMRWGLQWVYGKLFRQRRTFSRLHSNQRQNQDHHHRYSQRCRLRLGAICDTDCSDSWHAAWTALACDMCSCLWKSEQRTRGNGWAGPQKGGTTQEGGWRTRRGATRGEGQAIQGAAKPFSNILKPLDPLKPSILPEKFQTHHRAPGRPPPVGHGPQEPRASPPAVRSGQGWACGPQWDWPPQPGRAQWVQTWSPPHWSREWSPPCSPQCGWNHRAQPASIDLEKKI